MREVREHDNHAVALEAARLAEANIGASRLFHDCGGTFLEVSDAAGITGDAWSSSCALADLNSDG